MTSAPVASAPATSSAASTSPPATSSSRSPRRRASTPRSVRRLRRLQVTAVLLLLTFGALVVTALAVSFDASSRASESLRQYERLADARIQALKVQQSANTWALTPTDAVRADVTKQLTYLATRLADASAVDADRSRIVPLTGALVRYSMTLQDALNARGTASATLLAKADTQLGDELLTPLTAAATGAADRVSTELNAGWLPWVIGGAVVTLGGMVAISVALAKASHRYLNPGILLATLAALACVAILLGTSNAAASAASGFGQESRAELDSMATTHQQLHQMRADELLSVAMQGAGTSYQQRWATGYAAVRKALKAQAPPGPAEGDLVGYNAAHDQVVAALSKSQWDTASGVATGSSAKTFGSLDTSMNVIESNLRGPVEKSLNSTTDGVAAGIAGVVVLTLAGCWLAVWGVARRIEEYR